MKDDNFKKRYALLNPAQKQAVDRLDGPVMVIAGPGTGKTELLSMRVANILAQTDSLAENILCLTFTESGAMAMRERLVGLVGKEGHKVAIHTFHSFGSEIINKYSDFFYSGAHFRPADELSTHQILSDIFSSLPHSNPLAARMNGEFSYLKNVQRTISDFKKSGLTPDEIQRLAKHNGGFFEYAAPIAKDFFGRVMHKTMLDRLDGFYKKLAAYEALPNGVPNTEPISQLFLKQLAEAIETAQRLQKLTPITAWRNKWLEKNKQNEFVFKDIGRGQKLIAASAVYGEYLTAMQAASLYDYDDMILRLVHALEVFDELKFNLQEQYQYLLIDEFQDTNGAQMRILLSLTNNPIHAKRPNIMVVGDDDQAIYSFQGAEIGNITSFYKQFDEPLIVSLRKNYRSAPVILEHSREVISQAGERLEDVISGLNKTPLPARTNSGSRVELWQTATQAQEYDAIAKAIASRLKAGQDPSDVAVLARNHRDIRKLLPYLTHHHVPVAYEHQNNILDEVPIKAMVDLARLLVWIGHGRHDKVNSHLAELLAHPAWQCDPQAIWRLSIEAYNGRLSWLEVMQQKPGRLNDIATWLVDAAYQSHHQTLEYMVDYLYGEVEASAEKAFVSPLGEYFFSSDKLAAQPLGTIENIQSLRYLRQLLRQYQPQLTLKLKDLVKLVDKTLGANLRLAFTHEANGSSAAVQIMTAHKAKGQEFDQVFAINATDSTWGNKSRSRPSRLSYPANLPIAPAGETEDERLRLFFVAMTRARRQLIISYAQEDDAGKPTLKADFLETDAWQAAQKEITAASSIQQRKELAKVSWKETFLQPAATLEAAIRPLLGTYKLSATHLTNFLDVTRGGPSNFVLENLFHFPRAVEPAAALGSALHRTLKNAHEHLRVHKQAKPNEDVLYDFENTLAAMRLSESDFTHQLQKGSDSLEAYLAQRYQSFSAGQIAERDFGWQGAVVGDVRLTGIVDLMEADKAAKTIVVSDYKTGRPASSWSGKSDWEKIKLHRYRQQLLFYKLLVESSSDFRGYSVEKGVVEFIEPDAQGELHALELDYTVMEIEDFTKLISAVWRRIMKADFADISEYPQNYKGIVAFENDLLKG